MPVRWHVEAETGVRVLEEVALYEVSLVTFPANEHARVGRVKTETATLRNGDFIRFSDALDRAIHILG